MVIAWLMARKGLPLNDALAFLKSRRPLVSPNEGFMQQLAA
jgi:protein-tyrosine phosphatase